MVVHLGGWSPAGMHVLAHALWQQRCLEVDSRLHHVGVVDETRRTYRHHATRRASAHRKFRHAMLRASHHIATQRLSRWGSPAARARLARTVPLKRLWLRDGHVIVVRLEPARRRRIFARCPNTDPLSWREKVIPDLAGWSTFFGPMARRK